MKSQTLADLATALIADDKGRLAMDESFPTCNKRVAKLKNGATRDLPQRAKPTA